jgi:parvulin-like peptidyl-prolyl isomerase
MGGRVGFLEQGNVLKELEMLFKLKEGEISPVIKTDSGFHLFRIESIRPPRAAPLDEVKTRIMDHLFQQKMADRYEEWIDKLRSGAYISIK